ncbi:MAG: hypothetical protein AB7L66_15070 [Gemmatimonadales bacterium]
MKKLFALVAAAAALSGCGSPMGPQDQDEAAQAARARKNLEAAAPTDGPSLKLAAN